MTSRRTVIASGVALAAATSLRAAPATARASFVRREGTGLRLDGKPYRFAGANIWYGAYLGADAPYGNRARLRAELVALANLPAFYRWVEDTARLIKSIDRNHLVSTGSEGLKGCIERADIVEAEHRIAGVDYLTAHVWPLNWSWVDAADLAGTYAAGAARVQDYLDRHVAIATSLGKPLVVEEFGYPRDGGRYDPAATTGYKDRFYRQIYGAVLASVRGGGPVAGSNFWAWSGVGRAAHADHRFRPGDLGYLGDPPHEPQGWYGVFSSDESTKAIVREHAAALAAVGAA